jgi:hypothetical protein
MLIEINIPQFSPSGHLLDIAKQRTTACFPGPLSFRMSASARDSIRYRPAPLAGQTPIRG